MKKPLIFLIIIILFVPLKSIALDSSIWYKFPIPEYSYSHAYLSPVRILDWQIHGKDSDLNVGGTLVYNFVSQKEKSTIDYWGEINGLWMKRNREIDGKTSTIDMKSINSKNRFSATRYLSLLNVWSVSRLDIIAQSEQECRTFFMAEAGIGLGRIVHCSSVNQAIRLLQELDIKLDENRILVIATFLDKISVYKTQYRDTWGEIFFQKVAEMIGKPNQGLKVKRILTSSVYSAYYRSRGWEVKIGYMNAFFYLKDQPNGYLTFSAEYRIPWGLNKQINLRTRCNRNLDDESYSIDVDAYFLFQHSLTWASYISLFTDKEFHTTLEQGNAYYGVRIGSEKNIFNKLVSGLSMIFYKYRTSPDPCFDLSIDLKYYLW